MCVKQIAVSLCVLNVALAINHWALSENGHIQQKIDSPFFMREPNNLIAFLDQIRHNDVIEKTYRKLTRQREWMVDQINFSIRFGMDVIEEAKCALDFYQLEKAVTVTKITKNYLKRISLKKRSGGVPSSTHPFCWQYISLKAGIPTFEHLNSFKDRDKIRTEPEDDLKRNDLEFNSMYYVLNLVTGLEDNPSSWKYHALSSYYWRMKGDAHEAIECALRAIMLAPRKFRDIPLLSLGTILYRAEKLHDAEIVLSAAVDHAPEIAENHFALGTTLAMIYQFNRSIEHFETAEKLDPSFIPRTLHLKNFISCVENLNTKTAKMYSYVEFIKKEVNGLKQMKNRINSSHEKIIQQQVPLGARYIDTDTTNEELLNRGQYCSTRTLAGTEEPVLFCDFYSDLQMRLESNEVDIESLERELKANSDAIIKQLSKGLHKKFNFDKTKGKES